MTTNERLTAPDILGQTLSSIAIGDDFNYTYEPKLLCPVCGSDWTHVDDVYSFEGYDKNEGKFEGSGYGQTAVHGTLDGWRRPALAVVVWGECNHRWELRFQQHKGQTFIQWARLPDKED